MADEARLYNTCTPEKDRINVGDLESQSSKEHTNHIFITNWKVGNGLCFD